VIASGVTGVLAYNDLVAIGLMEGLIERGVDVPGDISVIGVDDIVSGRLSRPRLTTIAMPTSAAGRVAVDLLLQSADTDTTTGVIMLETSLIIRESTGEAHT
jgi:Transcriptional regulators